MKNIKKISQIVVSGALTLLLIFQAVPTLRVQAATSPNTWFRGGSIEPFTTTDFSSDAMHQALNNLKKDGANYATLIIPYYQSNRQSTGMHPGWNTPTDDSLGSAIDYAHSIGLKVMLKPHLETEYIEWRGNIDPNSSDRQAWFDSYADMTEHYARIGEAHHVEDYCIGAELIHMTEPMYNPGNTAHWDDVIARARAVFSGRLTYSANWDGEADQIEFWDKLDYIGISAYFDLYHAQNSSPAELEKSWDAWRTGVLQKTHDKFNKDIVFTEIGYRSITNAQQSPWDWSRGGEYNETDQANAYQALFDYWKDYPWMKGLHLWRWDINPPAANSGDTNYSPQNKKAEAVISAWWATAGSDPNPNPNSNPNPTPVPTPSNPPTGGTGTGTGNGTGGSTSTGSSWTATAVANPNNPSVGATTAVMVTVNNASSVVIPSSVVDIEIANSSDQNVFKKSFTGQYFGAHQTQTYNINWTAGSEGNYVVKTGVFSDDWKTNYYWNSQVININTGNTSPSNPPTSTTTPPTSTTTPPTSTSTDPVNPPPQTSTETSLNIWWPGDGVTVEGLQPFKAMLTDRNVADYDMYWQVDGDRLNTMYDSTVDYPHKEAMVDLNGWTWNNTGPYNINFVAKDKSSNIIKQKSVNITVIQ